MGRPPKPPEEKHERIVPIRLTKEEFEILDWYARRWGWSRSEILRRAWEEFVQNHALREKKRAEELRKPYQTHLFGEE